MKLYELKDIILKEEDVGITDKLESDMPFVDSWENWINGGLKTLDVDVLRIESQGYLLIVLNI